MALRSRQMRDVAVADADAARGGRVQSRDHAQRGRLAAARWPQQHGEAARRRGEADALDRGGLAILFGQVFQDERGHGYWICNVRLSFWRQMKSFSFCGANMTPPCQGGR